MADRTSPPPARWLDPTEDHAWRAWLQMTDLVRAHVARDLQECGLSESDYAVLVCLSEQPDHRVRMSDLAAVLGWSKSRLSHQVGRMETRGQLRKEGCPGDARGWFAVLTDDGLDDIRRSAPRHVASVRRAFLDALSAEQLAQTASIADAIVAHLVATGPPDDGACPSSGGCAPGCSDRSG